MGSLLNSWDLPKHAQSGYLLLLILLHKKGTKVLEWKSAPQGDRVHPPAAPAGLLLQSSQAEAGPSPGKFHRCSQIREVKLAIWHQASLSLSFGSVRMESKKIVYPGRTAGTPLQPSSPPGPPWPHKEEGSRSPMLQTCLIHGHFICPLTGTRLRNGAFYKLSRLKVSCSQEESTESTVRPTCLQIPASQQ